MEHHPLANVFPLLKKTEAAALADDIREHGLREPIVLLDGKILDGRNRYRACIAANVDPRTVPYDGNDPAAYVVSVNLKRRHLDESQRAIVAAKLAKLRRGVRPDASIEASATTQTEAAELLNVSRPSVQRARKVIERAAPEIVAAVEQGELSVSAAADFARQVEPTQQAALIERLGSAREAVRSVRPDEKVVKRAMKATPKLQEARDIIRSIYEVASCLYYDECSDIAENDRVTAKTFWEYLTVAGKDHAEYAGALDDAIKTLKAIRRAMPRRSEQPDRAA
jgi:ParB-like chromosome segregation protein Spo0J